MFSMRLSRRPDVPRLLQTRCLIATRQGADETLHPLKARAQYRQERDIRPYDQAPSRLNTLATGASASAMLSSDAP